MDNESIKQTDNSGEEEYQFSPDIDSSAATAFAAAPAATAEKANIFNRLKRKNIMIGVGVLVAAFIVYKFTDVLFTTSSLHRSTPPVTNAAATITPLATTTTQPSAPVNSINTPVTPSAPVQPVVSDAVNNRLSDIASRQADYQTGLDKLNSQMSDMQNSLSALNNQLSSLSNAVQTLASQFAAQQAAAEAVKKAAQQKVAQQKAHPAPKPVFFVRSMIPGRAWLLTGNGETLTVSVGDNLPGYGTVIAIDPVVGTLTTSTGAIIGFSPGDS